MALIPFGGNRQLSINIREPNAIQQGAGLHRLTFPVELDSRNTITGGVPVTLSGSAWLSVIGMDWLGTWTTERPVVTQEDQTFDAVLVLSLTDEQLAVVEKKRAGRDLRLTLDANVTLGYDPARADGDQNNRWPARSFQESIYLYSETWQRLLHQTATATSLAIVVPVPLDASAMTKAGVHLRDAIRKVNDGEYGDAVTAARKAIDDMGTSWTAEKSVVQTPKEQRTFDQRLALLRHALHALASPSAHGDPVATSITWDRERALAVIAGVAALAACKSLGLFVPKPTRDVVYHHAYSV
jgi:hypothetical protein